MTLRCSDLGVGGDFPIAFIMHFIPNFCAQISLAFHPQLTPLFLRLPAASEPQTLVAIGAGGGRETAGLLLQGAAVRFHCLFLKFPGRRACLFP